MKCALCLAITQDWRLIKESKYSFCSVIKWPLKLGHVIIIPKRHVEDMKELNKDEAKDLLDLSDYVITILQKVFGGNTTMHLNNGTGRTEEHLHFHILPTKGGIRDFVSHIEGLPRREEVSKEKTREMRDYIRMYCS